MAELIDDFHLGCGLGWAEGTASSEVFAGWRQCALMGRYIGATWRIRLNRSSAVAMRRCVKLLWPLLSLATPTYTVTLVAERFKPNTVVWAFHTIQRS